MALFDKQFDKKKTTQETAINVASVTLKQPEPTRPEAMPAAGLSNNPGKPAVIGTTIQVSGDIIGGENLLIEGRVEGTVRLDKHDLTIGVSGSAHANLTAKLVRIEGEVVGDVVGIERVIIASSGRVRGNITAPRVLVEDGAKFKGTIDMDFGDKVVERHHREAQRNGAAADPAVNRAAS
jgi:cytoskeletal protein CcmA (bactofilin family)